MSNTTAAMLKSLQCQRPSVVVDGLQAQIGGGQAAISLRDGAHRFLYVKNPGDSAVLPSLAGHEAMTGSVIVINDGTNAMSVYSWPGDTLNGTLNGSLSVPAGSVGILLKVDNGVTQDWRGVALA
jgi:hypothetical protein